MFGDDQRIEKIPIGKLFLWSENPREPFADSQISNLAIVKHALDDEKRKWDLPTLAEKMGGYYDYSELPIVVWREDRPTVYDGNRRVILGMLQKCFVRQLPSVSFTLPNFPDELPCCVCSHDVAVKSVWRKHAFNGSWDQLERDIFQCKFMHEKPSVFKMFDDATGGLIARTPKLNQGFVKKEVLTESNLKSVGIVVSPTGMKSQHSLENTEKILNALVSVVGDTLITRGENRGDLKKAIAPRVGDVLDSDKNRPYLNVSPFLMTTETPSRKKARRTARVHNEHTFELFGGALSLCAGTVNNMYRDICSLDEYYHKNQEKLSPTFHALIRMSLRLLCEAMSGAVNTRDLCDFVRANYEVAKKQLSQEAKTFLRAKTVDEKNFPQLLQTAGHNYTGMADYQQTVAMSLIIGKMLESRFPAVARSDAAEATRKEDANGFV